MASLGACRPNPAVAPVTRAVSEIALEGPVAARARGDWVDVEPAVRAACRRCSAGIARQRAYAAPAPVPQDAEPLSQIDLLDPFVARTIRVDVVLPAGETGTLTIERLTDLGPREPDLIVMTSRIGTAGHAQRAACLVDSLSWRLEQLAGVETAPIRWPSGAGP